MKKIILPQNKIALISTVDYRRVSEYKWYLQKDALTYYAFTNIDLKHISMSAFIKGKKPGFEIDHADGNGLNNQRRNLRYVTHSQNSMNRKPRKNCTSKYKGVWFNTERSIWQVSIRKNYKRFFLGSYHIEEDAAKAYNKAAKNKFGKYAKLNSF